MQKLNLNQLIDKLEELSLEDNLSKVAELQKNIKDLKKNISNFEKIENDIDEIRQEIIQPVNEQLEESRKENKKSYKMGIYGIIATAIFAIIPSLWLSKCNSDKSINNTENMIKGFEQHLEEFTEDVKTDIPYWMYEKKFDESWIPLHKFEDTLSEINGTSLAAREELTKEFVGRVFFYVHSSLPSLLNNVTINSWFVYIDSDVIKFQIIRGTPSSKTGSSTYITGSSTDDLDKVNTYYFTLSNDEKIEMATPVPSKAAWHKATSSEIDILVVTIYEGKILVPNGDLLIVDFPKYMQKKGSEYSTIATNTITTEHKIKDYKSHVFKGDKVNIRPHAPVLFKSIESTQLQVDSLKNIYSDWFMKLDQFYINSENVKSEKSKKQKEFLHKAQSILKRKNLSGSTFSDFLNNIKNSKFNSYTKVVDSKNNGVLFSFKWDELN